MFVLRISENYPRIIIKYFSLKYSDNRLLCVSRRSCQIGLGIDWVGSLYANRIFMYFCRSRVKLASFKSALNSPVLYSADRSKAVVPVLVLLFVALWLILQGDFLCLTLSHFVLVFFSPFSIAITSLGEKRANLSAFRTFVPFVLVWICRFPLPLSVWEGLRFVIVAFPGLFLLPLFWR